MSSFPYRRFIEENFMIIGKPPNDKPVPFKFNRVQKKYYAFLKKDYPDMDGIREVVLKARQQGFSSLILAIFTVDFIVKEYSKSVCISHRQGATEKLFKRVKFFIQSYCNKNEIDIAEYLSTDNRTELENRTNSASFSIGTAGAKVGERGGTVRNLHFSETAFYPDTGKFKAKEIVEASVQQVPKDHGMVFMESTGKNYGDFFQKAYEQARTGESIYKDRFFGWQEFYDDVWIEEKRKEFQDEKDFKREYPNSPEESFLYSGDPYFDPESLQRIEDQVKNATIVNEGRLARDGMWI